MIEINYFTTRTHFLRFRTSKIAKKNRYKFKKFLNTIEIHIMSQYISAWIRFRPEPEKNKKKKLGSDASLIYSYVTLTYGCSVQRRTALCTLCLCLLCAIAVWLSTPTRAVV